MKKIVMVGVLCGAAALVGSTGLADGAASGAKFECKNTDMDLVQGRVSYSKLIKNAKDPQYPYSAILVLKWGNLDRARPIPEGYYANWDGHVTIDQCQVKVVRKLCFDDKWQKNPKKPGPGEGSGADQLLEEEDPATVEWLSGVVGHIDALELRIDMPSDTATGEIKAGGFVIPLSIGPKPDTPTEDLWASKFEHKNSDMDMVRGVVSYAKLIENAQDPQYPYSAIVIVTWGNLDHVRPVPEDYYANWDGYAAANECQVKVARKVIFDDKWQNDPSNPGPGPGSGADQLLEEDDPAKVEWLSGVVGGIDALMIRIDMPTDTATGEIKAGGFVIPLSIGPKPNDKE